MGMLKSFLKRKLKKSRITSEGILEHLRKGGAEIGEDVLIYSPHNTVIDQTMPFLLKIGDHVRITEGVVILAHDYSWSVLKRLETDEIHPGGILGARSPVEIGSNVFIGMHTVITRGVTIGDNVIIGAGSVVTKDCPSDGFYAGNPARRIMSIEEFYRKRKACQFEEAKEIALLYRKRFGTMPPKEVFFEYFMLFAGMDEIEQVPKFKYQIDRMENGEDSVRYVQNYQRLFPDYNAFLEACYEEWEKAHN